MKIIISIITILTAILFLTCSNLFYDGINPNDGLISVKNNDPGRHFRLIKEIYYQNPEIPGNHEDEIYEYDSNNNLIKYSLFDVTNENIVYYYIEEYKYNENNQITKISYFEDSSKPYEYTVYEYDAENNIIRLDTYDENDLHLYYHIKEYDGNLLKKDSYYKTGDVLQSYNEYEYNDKGQMILDTNHIAGSSNFSYNLYEYDSKGNQTKFLRGNQDSVVNYTLYYYNEHSLLTENKFYNALDAYTGGMLYEYDYANRLKKQSALNQNHDMTSYDIYGYDTNGNNTYIYNFTSTGVLDYSYVKEYEEYFLKKWINPFPDLVLLK